MKIRLLHKLGISHNDYNPGNMLVDQNNNVFLIDFGKITFENELLPLSQIKKDTLNVTPKSVYKLCVGKESSQTDCMICNYSQRNSICCEYCKYVNSVLDHSSRDTDESFEHERNTIKANLDINTNEIYTQCEIEPK